MSNEHPAGRRYRAVLNKKLGRWHICHNDTCEYGETSIVASVFTSLDDAADAALAERIAVSLNACWQLSIEDIKRRGVKLK